MNCDSITENFLSKFYIEGQPVYAKIKWQNSNDHLFHIQVFNEENSWSGEFSYDTCKTFCENFEETDEQYANNVKDALKINNNMYTYDFKTNKDNGNIAEFYWKRKSFESSGTLLHGYVSVRKDEISVTKSEILDFVLNENKNLHMSIEEYKKNTEKLENELEKWRNELEKFVDIKNSLETTLYGKFIQLLNSKKRRIQELEDHLFDS